MTAEKSVEVGPVVATAMIAIGVATVVWAVATNPNRKVDKPAFQFTTGTTAPSLIPDPPPPEPDVAAVSDAEWEKTLVDVEAIKTDGLLTSINASIHTATVDADKWNALSDDRRRELGRHLAVYCGRVGGSDEYKVEIVDKNGDELGSYERD